MVRSCCSKKKEVIDSYILYFIAVFKEESVCYQYTCGLTFCTLCFYYI